MIVVSDSSPILNLAVVKKLDLLRDLYREIVVPPSVEQELLRNGVQLDPSWTRTIAPQNRNDVAALCEQLDPGEAESIVVATEMKAGLLLIDEAVGSRSTAVWK